jgi:DNA-binding CsgD family transcriptional regulator
METSWRLHASLGLLVGAFRGKRMVDTGRFSDFILELYRDARYLNPDELREQSLSRLRTFIPFDFAAWGGGEAADRVVTDVVVVDQSPRLFQDWGAVAIYDGYCDLALQQLNQPVLFDDLPEFRQSMAYLEHWGRFDARQMVATIMAEPVSGYVSFIGLCGADGAPVYNEADRSLKQLLMPHLSSALRLSREHTLVQQALEAEAVAMLDRAGRVLASRGPVAALMREEWGSSERVPLLPLPDEGLITEARCWRGRAVQLQLECAGNYLLMRIRSVSILSELTFREQQVAESFASGQSYKYVANQLQISPATVRNHLARIYDRLGIHSKSELIALLRGY